MTEEMYEVAFSGEIADGADADKVKANVAQIFKADETKLAHLFSGKRVVIKKDIDQQTALKYQLALTKAGAVCEVVNLSDNKPVSAQPAESKPTAATTVDTTAVEHTYTGDVPAAPKTVPLDISADQIDDLPASLAPVGSIMQDEKKEIPEIQVDLSGLDMAPAGSDLGVHKDKPVPPPPDTSGLTLKE